MIFLRSCLFSLGMILITMIHASLSFLTVPFSPPLRYHFITLWSRMIICWAKVCCGIHYQVHGLENIPKQNAIILSNHQSTWETLALQIIFPMQTWTIKRELLHVPFFGWALRLLAPIAIDRRIAKTAIKQLINQGKQRLAEGYWIVIFPEGTRIAIGKRHKFSRGGAILAIESGYPIIPVAHNAGEFWPRRGFLKTPGVIQVFIGPAIISQDRDPEKLNEQVKTWIYTTLAQIKKTDV